MGHMAMTHNRRILQMFCLATAVVFIFGILHFCSEQANVHSVSELASSKATSLVNMHGSRKTMARSMVRSESVWAKTVNQRHEIIAADWGDISEMPLYSAVDRASFDTHPYNVWDFMPASYNCPWDVERIGRMGDGGKWVCGMSRYEDYPKDRECVIYSFGVRDESSFEQEMLSRTKCVVWAYDFSVVDFGKQVDSKHRDRAHFMQVGVTGTTNTTQNPPFYSIADLMEMNGHDYVDIIKMDVEGAEYDALDRMHRDFPLSAGKELPFGQLMIEIHLLKGETSKTLLEWWERLEAHGLRAAWTEPNLIAVTIKACQNPCTAEYTVINVHDSKSILIFDD